MIADGKKRTEFSSLATAFYVYTTDYTPKQPTFSLSSKEAQDSSLAEPTLAAGWKKKLLISKLRLDSAPQLLLNQQR